MHLQLTEVFIKRFITGIILGSFFWLIFLYFAPIYFSLLLAVILSIIIVFEWKRFFPVAKPWFWVVMPFYPILPFALLIHLNHLPMYHNLILVLFVIVFSFDTGSYVVGTLLGKHYLCPSVSQGKTWEGAIGGFVFAIIGFRFLLWEQDIVQSWSFIILFTFIVSLLSLCGDLFESWLKRRAHIKDSGCLLPGHGGFLDRFDGILFAVFFFYFFKSYLIQLFS